MIGHTALRLYVLGDAAYERAATPEETREMSALVREALAAGAAGFEWRRTAPRATAGAIAPSAVAPPTNSSRRLRLNGNLSIELR